MLGGLRCGSCGGCKAVQCRLCSGRHKLERGTCWLSIHVCSARSCDPFDEGRGDPKSEACEHCECPTKSRTRCSQEVASVGPCPATSALCKAVDDSVRVAEDTLAEAFETSGCHLPWAATQGPRGAVCTRAAWKQRQPLTASCPFGLLLQQ